ncbi:hypothetical protein ZWY2020_020490 [Hordeum vulgare]|nr:hypothetical protein ZWY2020_020490 [Hordeum vulgare]
MVGIPLIFKRRPGHAPAQVSRPVITAPGAIAATTSVAVALIIRVEAFWTYQPRDPHTAVARFLVAINNVGPPIIGLGDNPVRGGVFVDVEVD